MGPVKPSMFIVRYNSDNDQFVKNRKHIFGGFSTPDQDPV